MKLILLVAIILGAAYFYPERHEGAPTACAALTRRVIALLPVREAKLVPPAADAGEAVKTLLPMLPPEAGCTVVYWLAVAKPDLLESLAAGLFTRASAPNSTGRGTSPR